MPIGKPNPGLGKKLYEMNKGGKSAQEIANELGEGFTRSSVLGYIHRYKKKHGIGKDSKAKQEADRRGKQKAGAPKINPNKPEPKPETSKVTPLHKKLEDLVHTDCRYPYGDGPFTFCGNKADEGSSYCKEHRELCSGRILPPMKEAA